MSDLAGSRGTYPEAGPSDDAPDLTQQSPKTMDSPSTTILCDHAENIPLTRRLSDEDLILLLTPVIVPPGATPDSQDPFEPLGRAIAAHHPLVRHVPYTKQGGITSTHAAFIKRCRAIIFVITGPPSPDEPSQADFAETVSQIAEKRPRIIVSCCDIQINDFNAERLPTIIQTESFVPSALTQVGNLLFRTYPSPSPPPSPPPTWSIKAWSPNRDLPAITSLWRAALPKHLHLPQHVLGPLLRRDGYAAHLAVRDPRSGALVAFCATYTTYPSTLAPRLLGALALLIVHPDQRRRGLGTALNDAAVAKLRATRGVDALVLGSSFPRLLAGAPPGAEAEWFARRGWPVRPGGEISDWVVSLDRAWVRFSPSAADEVEFRACEAGELERVVGFAERDADWEARAGYGEQFTRLAGTSHVEDVVAGFEGTDVVAAALVYVPRDGSPAAADIPWARTLGEDVGGVTCVCVQDEDSGAAGSGDAILLRLLSQCAKHLAQRGMKQMYVDGLRGNNESLQKLGFRQWSTYIQARRW